MLNNIPSIPTFFRAFIMKGHWILSKAFFCIYWGDHVVFVLTSVYMLYYIYGFIYVEPSLHPWNETHLVMVYDLFLTCCWILFASILLRIFASTFIKYIGL
jgi:hypothetical protein